MRQTLLGKRLWYVLLAVCLLVGLTTASARIPGQKALSSVMGYGLAPVESALSGVVRFAKALGADVGDIWSLRRRNRALETEVVQLQAEVLADSELKADNARLSALLAAERSPLPSGVGQGLAAEVIGRSPDNWFATVVVDRGSASGVRPGMIAVDPTGLVGQVASVNAISANITLLTNPRYAVGAMVAGSSTETEGVITGELGSALLSMRLFSTQADIAVGDRIVTSGLGGVYPAGLPIGVVSSVGSADFGFTRQAQVRPTSQLGSLQAVLLINALPQVP